MRNSLGERRFAALAAVRRLRPPRSGFLDKTLRRLRAFFVATILRDEIARRPGLLQHLHPRARLLAAILFLISVSLASSLPALSAHAALAATGVALARIRCRELLGAGLLIACVFSLLMALPAVLNLVSGGDILLPLLQFDGSWQAGPWVIPRVVGVSGQGLRTAGTFLLRTLTSTTAVLCVALSTPWTDLLASLRSLRLPPFFLQTIGMTVRYLHLLLRQSEEVHLGKKSRTICRRPLVADQMWVGSRIAAAWEKSLHLMTEVSDAMATRGFTGNARFAPVGSLEATDWAFLLLTVALCVGAHFA